jgi:hypothetical protein
MIRRQCSPRTWAVPARNSAQFVAMIPQIQKQLRFAFRHSSAAVRQEQIDDALGQAFVLFAHLVRRRRVRLAHPTALARFAACHVRSGRLIGSSFNSRDVLSRATQQRFGFRVIPADQDCWKGHSDSAELLGESRHATPAELAASRIDFASWLSCLSNRQRAIALCLAVGESTGEVARRFQVSGGRISQVRSDLATRWRQLQGERPQAQQSAVRMSARRSDGGPLPLRQMKRCKLPRYGQTLLLPAIQRRDRT